MERDQAVKEKEDTEAKAEQLLKDKKKLKEMYQNFEGPLTTIEPLL